MQAARNFVQSVPNIATAGPPTREQYASIAKAGVQVVVNLATTEHPDAVGDQRVFVHCIMNYRVSAFVFLYLVHVRGWAAAEARAAAINGWTPDAVWTEVLGWDREDLSLGE